MLMNLAQKKRAGKNVNTKMMFLLILTSLLAVKLSYAEQGNSQVYGVRWSVGRTFIYKSPSQPQQPKNTNYYVLSFNTDQLFDADVFVKIKDSMYTCSGRKLLIDMTNYQKGVDQQDQSDQLLDLDNETQTVIYKCFVNQDLYSFSEIDVNYSIFTSKPIYMKEQNPDYNNGTHTIIDRQVRQQINTFFQGKFRPPPTENYKNQKSTKFIALGDWGVGKEGLILVKDESFYEIVPSMLKLLQNNSEIRLAIFLGDIAYDFVGEKYFAMLKKIQPLSSRICFMTTPGNHDYVYHEEAFELFTQTFLSPEWNGQYDFYYNFIVGGVMFVQYTPEKVIYKENYSINMNPLDQMREQWSDSDRQYIKDHYDVIVFSHYPIYCSNLDKDSVESCEKNEERLSDYITIFNDMGMDMYISGHIHNYQRFNEVCQDGKLITPSTQEGQVDVYAPNCPIYIIEGAAGFSIAMFQKYDKLQNSSKLIFGVGYGLVDIQYNTQSDHRIFYQHFLVREDKTAIVSDTWIRELNPIQTDAYNRASHVVMGQVLTIIILLAVIGGICFWHRYGLHKKHEEGNEKKQQHIEMVEEQFQTMPYSERLEHQGMSNKSNENQQN